MNLQVFGHFNAKMRNQLPKILFLGFVFLVLLIPVFSQSAEDSDGDGVSDTLELERGTDPFSDERGIGAITGFMSKASPESVSKEFVIGGILVATIGIEIGIYWFSRKKE